MPKIVIDRVFSVNSEDSAYPAENLIDANSKKQWKCQRGEKQAIVILQLKQETVIESIDIGNEHSAFVEILVGKSTSTNNDFKVLLVASSLMTLKESKDGTNTRGVRFFKKEQLTQPTADEKWERVKIVCTQPFNKHVQYGLSFVVLHSSSGGDEESEPKALGRFNLKQEDNSGDDVSVGSWFAKRKDPPPTIPAKAAAAIRDASSPVNIAQSKNKKPTPKRATPKVTTPNNGATGSKMKVQKPDTSNQAKPKFNLTIRDDDDSPADDTDADSNYSPTKDSQSRLSDDDDIPESDEGSDSIIDKRPKRNKKVPNTKGLNGVKRKMNDPGSSSKAKVAKLLEREMKPFRRLLEGVTFVISGYQNPLRADLRTKAIEMGARYKPDWDHSCTHLICAFKNTPKFSQVQGRGKIVKKEWIEECHSRRKRLPWRRFALDRNHAGTSSEEEVWEEVLLPSTSNVNTAIASGVNRRNVSSGSGSDTEEEIERVRAKKTANKVDAKTANKADAKPTIKANAPNVSKHEQADTSTVTVVKTEDRFSDETDVDSDGGGQTAQLPLPPLPDFLDNIKIHIALDIQQEERKKLTRYITAYKGVIVEETDNSMEYVISNSTAVAATFNEHFGIPVVSPDWIWQSSDEGKRLPPLQFKLKYNLNNVMFFRGR